MVKEGAMGQVLQNETDFAAYHVEALLGRGGMSEVYRASNPRLENTIALKLLARELTEDQTFRERFIRESRLAASLNHPNVVPIFDAGEWEGMPYIAMRFVDGPDLKQLIESRGRLAPDFAMSVVGQVASALDCAHEKGLVHRDVKPGNILVDENVGDGSVPHVYLADFGVAKHSQSHSGLTSKGHYVGTIDYVAPEQIEGRTLSAATDVYSLGCVLFECLTGLPPFDHDSDVAMIFAHLREAPPAPSSRRPDLPAALDAVIAKALAKKPEARYASCRELLAAARAAFEADAPETALGVPLGQVTIPSTLPAVETVLAGSGRGTGIAPSPPTELAAPATELPAERGTATPPTELAAEPWASVQPEEDKEISEGPYTLRNRRAWRSRRRLVIAFAALLLAAGTAVAAPKLVGSDSSGKKTPANKNSSSSSGQSGSILNPGSGSSTKKDNRRDRSGTSTTKSNSSSTTTSTNRRNRTSTTTSSSSSSSSSRRDRSGTSTTSSTNSSSSRRDRGGSSSGSTTTSSGSRRTR
jgi:serine/threonine protein kinase